MIQSIEVQVISRLLTTKEESDIDALLSFDDSYFSAYLSEIQYIRKQYDKYQQIPSIFDFQAQFNEFTVVQVPEKLEYLEDKLREYKQYLILIETFNKISNMGEADTQLAWQYLEVQCEKANGLSDTAPMNIVSQAEERAELVKKYAQQQRIPTGFAEIDRAMYGGLSTIEEFLIIIARTGNGKSWICTRMMESAQKAGFRVAYYSPEMQAAYLATRFDTWRGHFENSQLYQGKYSQDYYNYLHNLSEDDTPAFVIEDKDFENGVSVRGLSAFVKKHQIQLLVIDGLSYMVDDQGATTDYQRYKNISAGLFQLSKRYGCAVVCVVQSNRDIQRDDKGESLPSLYNIEGSDHPGRICTQAFAIRQIFDKHILDIGLLKARMADNRNPVYSYAWDINTGNVSYMENAEDTSDASNMSAQTIQPTVPTIAFANAGTGPDLDLLSNDFNAGEVEF